MRPQATHTPASSLTPLLCLLAVGGLLGVSTNLAKAASNAGIEPLTALTVPLLIAASVLSGTAFARDGAPNLSARRIEYYVVAALTGIVTPNLIFFNAVAHVGAGIVSLVIALPPLFTYLGALALRAESFSTWRAVGVVSAMTGMVLIGAREVGALDAPIGWLALTASAPLLLAIGNLYRTLRWPPGANARELAPGMLCAATIALLVVSLHPDVRLSLPTDDPMGLAILGAQAIVFTSQYKLLFVLQERGGPVYLSLLGAVGAVVGIPLAGLLFDEPPPAGLMSGGVLIGVGMFLLTWRGSAGSLARSSKDPRRSARSTRGAPGR